MTARHTPGPWKVQEPTQWIVTVGSPYGRGQMHIADVRGWGHLTGKGGGCAMEDDAAIAIQEANAALIASAPDLLAERDALREQVALLSSADHVCGIGAVEAEGARIEREQELETVVRMFIECVIRLSSHAITERGDDSHIFDHFGQPFGAAIRLLGEHDPRCEPVRAMSVRATTGISDPSTETLTALLDTAFGCADAADAQAWCTRALAALRERDIEPDAPQEAGEFAGLCKQASDVAERLWQRSKDHTDEPWQTVLIGGVELRAIVRLLRALARYGVQR